MKPAVNGGGRVAVLALLICVLTAAPLRAHPMGNFSVGQYTAIRVDGGFVKCRYRVDLAEVPSMEQMSRLDPEGTGVVTEGRKDAFFKRALPTLAAGQKLTINGQRVPLEATHWDLLLRPGASDVPTILLSIDYRVPLPAGVGRVVVEYEDTNYPTRRGWREVVAEGGAGGRMVETTTRGTDASHALDVYPADVSSVPDVRSARIVFELAAGNEIVGATTREAEPANWVAAPPTASTTRSALWNAAWLATAVVLGLVGAATRGIPTAVAAPAGSRLRLAGAWALREVAVVLPIALLMAAAWRIGGDGRIVAWAGFGVSGGVAGMAAWQALQRYAERSSVGRAAAPARDDGGVRRVPGMAAWLVLLIGIALGRPAFGVMLVVGFAAGFGAMMAMRFMSRERSPKPEDELASPRILLLYRQKNPGTRKLVLRLGTRQQREEFSKLPRSPRPMRPGSIAAPMLIALFGVVVGLRSLALGGVLRFHLAADLRPGPRLDAGQIRYETQQRRFTMRAAWYERKGPARDVLIIGDMPTPEPGAMEVRVRNHASGVNPTDVKARAGWGPNTTMPFPRVIPHHDGAGIIESVGPGVSTWHVGDRVWVYEAQWRRPFGTAAEWVVLPARNVAPLPRHIGFAEGAALGIPAMTAHRCLFQDGPIRGQIILITGGAGAVGNAAVQLAKWGGATVVTTISRPEQAEAARRAGADHVIDYKTDDVPARIRDILRAASVEGLDRVVEVSFAQNIVSDLGLLKPGGVISTYAAGAYDIEARFPFYPAMFKGITMHFVLEYIMPESAHVEAVQDVTTALRDRALQPQIARRFPLEQIADAHEAVEGGKLVGKVVVEVG